MAGEKVEAVVEPSVAVKDTPEFKEEVKKNREELEKTIRASNQQHLEEQNRKLKEEYERLYGTKPPVTAPPATDGEKDFFTKWGDKHGLPPEAGLELAQGIVAHVDSQMFAPRDQRGKMLELRAQRADLRQSQPDLVVYDDKYHAEAIEIVKDIAPGRMKPDTYAAALEMVIGHHIKDVVSDDRKGRMAPETPEVVKPGPTPTASTPKVKGKVTYTQHQLERAEQTNMTPEDFGERVIKRAQGMKGRGFSDEAIRQALGKDLGTLTY